MVANLNESRCRLEYEANNSFIRETNLLRISEKKRTGQCLPYYATGDADDAASISSTGPPVDSTIFHNGWH
jgi:hypothetical protein